MNQDSPLPIEIPTSSSALPKEKPCFSIESKGKNPPRIQAEPACIAAPMTIFFLEEDSEIRKDAYVGELRSRKHMCAAQARVILNFPMSHRCKAVQKTNLWESHYSGRMLL